MFKDENVHELVQNLLELLRDQDLSSIFRSQEYMQKWVAENVDFESHEKKDVFFLGFYVGAKCIQELNADKSANEKSGKRKSFG